MHARLELVCISHIPYTRNILRLANGPKYPVQTDFVAVPDNY